VEVVRTVEWQPDVCDDCGADVVDEKPQ